MLACNCVDTRVSRRPSTMRLRELSCSWLLAVECRVEAAHLSRSSWSAISSGRALLTACSAVGLASRVQRHRRSTDRARTAAERGNAAREQWGSREEAERSGRSRAVRAEQRRTANAHKREKGSPPRTGGQKPWCVRSSEWRRLQSQRSLHALMCLPEVDCRSDKHRNTRTEKIEHPLSHSTLATEVIYWVTINKFPLSSRR